MTGPAAADLRQAAAVLMDCVRWRREYERGAACPCPMRDETDRLAQVAAWLEREAASDD
jgi:hypothetical protein